MPRTGDLVSHTRRDAQIYFALALTPMTVRQLFDYLVPTPHAFPNKAKLRRRLILLLQARRIRRHLYATEDRGLLPYYTLSPLGYRLLDQLDPGAFRTIEQGKPTYDPVSVLSQLHTRGLADIIGKFVSGAHAAGIRVLQFYQENRFTIDGGVSIKPDAYVACKPPVGRDYHFPFEYHRPTRRNKLPRNPDAWPLRTKLYETYRNVTGIPLRVPVWADTQRDLRDILAMVRGSLTDPTRPLVIAALREEFLASPNPLFDALFLDHFMKPVALFPRKCLPHAKSQMTLAQEHVVC